MKIKNFEDILSWKKSQDLSLVIYKIFKENKDYSFRDQIQRAMISVSNNIAEGFERRSNKEFIHFLYIARGSCGEVRSMIYIAKELGYISQEEFNNLHNKLIEISKLIFGLIKTL
jgi:four helix bundle protein